MPTPIVFCMHCGANVLLSSQPFPKHDDGEDEEGEEEGEDRGYADPELESRYWTFIDRVMSNIQHDEGEQIMELWEADQRKKWNSSCRDCWLSHPQTEEEDAAFYRSVR